MDLAATLEQLGIDRESASLVILLPLVHVAWADGKVQRAEREAIIDIARERGWLEGRGAELLEKWLTERPSDAQLATGIALLNHLAKERVAKGEALDADDLQALLALCNDVADAAGGLFGLGKHSSDEAAALQKIAAALDIENARSWRDAP